MTLCVSLDVREERVRQYYTVHAASLPVEAAPQVGNSEASQCGLISISDALIAAEFMNGLDIDCHDGPGVRMQ